MSPPSAAAPARGARIGFVLARYPVLSETFILRELHELWRTGTEVSVYAFGGNPDSLVHPMAASLHVPVVILPERHRRRCIAGSFAFWAARAPGRLVRALRHTGGAEAFRAAMGALYLAEAAIPHRPAHFHAHYLSAPAAAARTMAILHGVTFSVTAHAHDIFLSDPHELGTRIRQAAWVRTISQYNKRILWGLVPPSARRRVQVVRVGIDIEAHSYRPPRPGPSPALIVTVGRLVPIKGMDVLMRAVAMLPHRRWTLSIVGAGPLDGALRQLGRELGIADRVRFEGPLVEEEVREVLGRADVFALAAQRDPTGNMDGLPSVLVEALAMGVPTVSTTVSGIPELLGAGAGVLVPPGDPGALASAIESLIDDAGLRRSVSERGRRKVERWWNLKARCGDLSRKLGSLAGSGLAHRAPER